MPDESPCPNAPNPAPSDAAAIASRGRSADSWRADAATAATSRHLRAALAALGTLGGLDPASAAAVAAAKTALREAAASQNAFLHSAAHDLRNPLAAIRGQVQLLQRRARRFDLPPADAARIEQSLTAVDDAVDRTTALVDHLLDASWLNQLPLDPPQTTEHQGHEPPPQHLRPPTEQKGQG